MTRKSVVAKRCHEVLCVLPLLLAAAAAPAADLARYEATEPHMGTLFKVLFYADDPEVASQAARAALERIGELDRCLSDYNPASELSQLGRGAPHAHPVPVSDDLWHILARAQDVSRLSGGAFDVTIGPLTKLWRRGRRQHQWPDAERLAQARAAVGYQHLKLDASRRTAQLTRGAMRLDAGGIAKGYAADEALRVLRRFGVQRALVDAGGGMALGAPPPGQAGWKVGVATLSADAPPERFLRLSCCGIATSGDAWQFVELQGQRYSHIIDPRSGQPVTVRSSVTVVARDGTTADALATALSVLGPHRGMDLIEQLCGAEARLVWLADDDAEHQRESRGFVRLPSTAN